MKQQNITQDSTERWVEARLIRPDGTVEIYSNYMVSDHGRVASLVNHMGNKRPVMKIRKPSSTNKYGYQQVILYIDKKRYTCYIHRLVLSSFYPEGWSTETNEVDHIDKNPTNNHLSNLHWIGRKGNITNRDKCPLKKIRVTYLNDGHVEEFDSMHDVSRTFGKTLRWCATMIIMCNGFNKKYNIKIEKIEK